MNEPASRTLLKRDLLGSVCRIDHVALNGRAAFACIERDTGDARWWLRPAARRLAAREALALAALRNVPGVPRLLQWDGRRLQRSWLDGQPMQRGQPRDPAYYREALRLIRRLHAAGVLHNDLAEEPNWRSRPRLAGRGRLPARDASALSRQASSARWPTTTCGTC